MNTTIKTLLESITETPPTVKQRHDFGELWKTASDIDKFEVACKLSHVTISKDLLNSPEFIQVCALIAEMDYKYGTVTIPE
jgi:hypothetical protein